MKRLTLASMWAQLPRQPKLYHLFKTYVDRYNGENDDNPATNGEWRLLRATLPASHVVFDIGANIGAWAAHALQINPALELHCFEPSRQTFAQLVARQFGANVVCNNFGMSATPGEATLHVFAPGAGTNSLYRREGLEAGWQLAPQPIQESVHLETVDGYCQARGINQIDFCKIDVEGHELQVLQGMEQMLRAQAVRLIQFEYGGCNIDARVLLKDLFAFFHAGNYTLAKIFPTELRAAPQYDQRLENFQYQNWVAQPKSDAPC